METIQMHLSQKEDILSDFICAFFKSALNFEIFQKKYDLGRLCISEITEYERRA